MRRTAQLTSALVLLLATLAYAIHTVSYTVTVVTINKEAKSMTVTYTPLGKTAPAQLVLLWDEKTKFTNAGKPGSGETGPPTTAAAIKKGTQLHVSASDRGVAGDKFWLLSAEIQPSPK